MKIFPTQFDREGGGVTALYTGKDDAWCLRAFFGPAFFWDTEQSVWVPVTAFTQRDAYLRKPFIVPLAEALRLLVTLNPPHYKDKEKALRA